MPSPPPIVTHNMLRLLPSFVFVLSHLCRQHQSSLLWLYRALHIIVPMPCLMYAYTAPLPSGSSAFLHACIYGSSAFLHVCLWLLCLPSCMPMAPLPSFMYAYTAPLPSFMPTYTAPLPSFMYMSKACLSYIVRLTLHNCL